MEVETFVKRCLDTMIRYEITNGLWYSGEVYFHFSHIEIILYAALFLLLWIVNIQIFERLRYSMWIKISTDLPFLEQSLIEGKHLIRNMMQDPTNSVPISQLSKLNWTLEIVGKCCKRFREKLHPLMDNNDRKVIRLMYKLTKTDDPNWKGWDATIPEGVETLAPIVWVK